MKAKDLFVWYRDGREITHPQDADSYELRPEYRGRRILPAGISRPHLHDGFLLDEECSWSIMGRLERPGIVDTYRYDTEVRLKGDD